MTVEQIVVARRIEPRESDRERDLRPMAQLVQKDVEEELSRRHGPHAIAHVELTDLVRLFVAEVADVLLELPPDRCAVVEERRYVVPGEARGGRERLPVQPLQVSPLDDEDVVDQLADGRKASGRLNGAIPSRPGA